MYPADVARTSAQLTTNAFIRSVYNCMAAGLFLLCSALNGVTFSVLLMLFSKESIAAAFFISAGTFMACSVYSIRTRQDLTSLGSFGAMGLIGIIIASIVNLFFGSSGISIIINYVGVIVFVALTAYDTQKLKEMALSQPTGLDAGTIRKGAIIGALTLYLDFINLFIILLHIIGGNRK